MAAARCTTRRGNAHRTEIAEEREVFYRWHPWAGCIVRVHEAVEKVGRIVLRCSRDSVASERWMELPAWMFDRATCMVMRVISDPVVEFAALLLAALQELLAAATAHSDTASSSNTPVSNPAGEAHNQDRGRTMRQRTQGRARDRRQIRQFDLFGEQAPIIDDWPAPAWQGLPEETRRVLTELMSRPLLDHAGLEHRPSRTEAADNV